MNATRKRRPLQPATGSCRWAARPTATQPGELVITAILGNGQEVTESYTVADNCQDGNLLGYRLTKQDNTTYDLPVSLNDCSCPDFVYNRAHATTVDLRLCKHCRGLAVALAALER
jgi:hypothetical protein